MSDSTTREPDETAEKSALPTELASTILIWMGLMLLFVFVARSLAAGMGSGGAYETATATVREAGWACTANGGFQKWCAREVAERSQGGHFVRFSYRDGNGMELITLLPTDQTGLTPDTAKKGAEFQIAYDPTYPGQVVQPSAPGSDFAPLVGLLGLGALAAGVWLRFGRRSPALAFVDEDELDDPLTEGRSATPAAFGVEAPAFGAPPSRTSAQPQSGTVFGRRRLTGS